MKTNRQLTTRRTLLQGMLAAASAPMLVPARVLGLEGKVSPSNKLTLGVIGVGSQGTVDMRGFLNHEDVRVVAICDVNQKNLTKAKWHIKESYGSDDVKLYPDFRELNRDASIDAVLMALPVHWHSIPSLDAIQNGKHLYHEKPMAMSLEESLRVRAAVRERKKVFQFGTQQRSDLKFRWACELALNGRVGRLREIHVGVPGGKISDVFPEQAVPEYINWDRWVGPSAMSAFNEQKLQRDNHENISAFSLGMVSCWGIHHLDMAQWGNGTELTGPTSIEGQGAFPSSGTCDNVLNWNVRFEFAKGAPILFTNERKDDPDGIKLGAKFIGENGWIHVTRGQITASDTGILRDPQNKAGEMPIKLPVSIEHYRNFLDAIKTGSPTVAGIETAVRTDTLCQTSLIAIKQGRKLQWDPEAEHFLNDDAANAMLKAREFRGEWKLPT